MINKASRAVSCIALAPLAGAAAAQEADPQAEPDAAETCISISRAEDIAALSDQHVYVGTIGGNHYLLTLTQVCPNLLRSSRSGGLRFQPFGRQVCPNDGSHVRFDWFDRETICPIATIEQVENRAEARAIAEEGRIPVQVEEVTLPD